MGKVIETVADSIAIEIINKSTILIGKGNELHLYKRNSTKKNVFDSKVLPVKLENKIHGIRKTQNSCNKVFIVYGEKEFVLLECSENFKFYDFYRAKLSDWICCGLFLDESSEFLLLTAHSILLRFSYDVAGQKCDLKERISCIDKSTLYCAQLFGNKWNEVVVFAGNAFGELLIWQPSNNKENKAESLKPKVSPLLHRISAHNGVIFSIDYDDDSKCLVTTSDDRAVKWWKVEFTTKSSWNGSTLQALSSGYGHVARVFKGRIINDGPDVYALSGGEDSYFCLWDKNGLLLFKRRQQYGAIIWNFVYDYDTKTIYTVGSTGNLVAYGLNQVLKETQNPKNPILLPPLSGGDSTEYISKVKFLNEEHLIGVTNVNKLMTSMFKGKEWLSWKNLPIRVDFKCTLMEAYQNIIAICGFKRLMLLRFDESFENFTILIDEDVLEGVIRTFVFFTKQQYLICDDNGRCLLFMNSVNNKRYLDLPKCKEPWLTTALLINQQQHIVVSNRQGNLLLYQLHKETDYYEFKHIIKHPHGNLGATCLICAEEKFNTALIQSAGHDGAINVFLVDFMKNTIQTCSRQIVSVAWVECVEKYNKDSELFLGFNDNHFVAWCKDYDFLLNIPCGGGHRSWHFAINYKTGTISIVFIQNKRVRFYKMPLFNKELTTLPLAKGWHVAPCNTMQILPQISFCSYIAVTAGDDNLLKIHTFNTQTGLKTLKDLHNHISNIRCLKVLYINENEFLVFSGGGRAQLCVTKVNSSTFHINELINYTLRQGDYKFNSKSYNFDPETRLMSLDVKVLNKDEYEIYVGCSDGFVKCLKLNLERLEILLQAQHFYNRCLLQLRYVAETDLIVVAATDGYLKFFNSSLSKCLYQLQHHSSGINGLSVLYNISNKSLQILSGGDDQVVSFTELSVEDLGFQVLRQFHKPYLHTSQVSACALSSNGLYGFTSGVDQVLNKLDLRTGQVLESFYSCVSDVKGVALFNDNICLLYGCGLQIYAFNN